MLKSKLLFLFLLSLFFYLPFGSVKASSCQITGNPTGYRDCYYPQLFWKSQLSDGIGKLFPSESSVLQYGFQDIVSRPAIFHLSNQAYPSSLI